MNDILKVPHTELLKKCLLSAVDVFNKRDALTLLAPGRYDGEIAKKRSTRWGGASERAIAHRLAVYLEAALRTASIITVENAVTVDCEYNRHLDGPKIQRVSTDLLRIVEEAKRTATRATDDESFFMSSQWLLTSSSTNAVAMTKICWLSK